MNLLVIAVLSLMLACTGVPNLPEVPERSDLPVLSRIDLAHEDVLAEPTNAEANGELGRLLHRYKDIRHAEVLYRRAYLLDPSSFQWQYHLASAQASLDHYDEAAVTYRRALETDPDYAAARLQLARLTYRMGNVVECEQLSRELISHPQAAPIALYWLGRLAGEQGDFASATKHLSEALDRSPEFGAAHFALARALLGLSQPEVAREHFILADRHKYAFPPVDDPLLSATLPGGYRAIDLVRQGYELERQGRLDEAETSYWQALLLDPRSGDAHARMILVLATDGRAIQAVEHYTQATSLDPDQADAFANYGLLRLMQERHQEAVFAFEQALRLNPFQPEALLNRGLMLEGNRQREEAEEMYRKAIACRPEFRDAHLRLGRVLVQSNRYAEAFEHIEAAVATEDKRTPRLLLEASRIYTLAGARTQATDSLHRAHQLATKLSQPSLLDEIESQTP